MPTKMSPDLHTEKKKECLKSFFNHDNDALARVQHGEAAECPECGGAKKEGGLKSTKISTLRILGTCCNVPGGKHESQVKRERPPD